MVILAPPHLRAVVTVVAVLISLGLSVLAGAFLPDPDGTASGDAMVAVLATH